MKDKKVAIVGGGPGGLTLARLLQIKGVDVKVYERDINPNVRLQGATLDLHDESGLKALRQAGLIEVFKVLYRPGADKTRLVNGDGDIKYDQHLEETVEAFGERWFRPEIDRRPLRELLLNSLQEGTVVWDSHILSLVETDNSWKLEFQGGRSAVADFVVAADGANSKIRRFVTPIKAFYTGLTIVEGTVDDAENSTPKIHKLLNGGKIFAFAEGKTIIVSAKGDGSLAFYAGFKADEHWVRDCGINFKNPAQLLAWFKQEFSTWGSIWYEIFENDKTFFMPRQIRSMPLDQNWEARANITMLGDAAHLMTPYAGEGVNMAMLDALELSEGLTGGAFEDPRSAIAAYEKQMRTRASIAAKASFENGEMMHSPNGLSMMMEMFAQN
jgi:2-polyprenyl-6-methoxyphenol hydroxylase-like FAD-dependent oxidoreductase